MKKNSTEIKLTIEIADSDSTIRPVTKLLEVIDKEYGERAKITNIKAVQLISYPIQGEYARDNA